MQKLFPSRLFSLTGVLLVTGGILWFSHRAPTTAIYVFKDDPHYRYAVADPTTLTEWQRSWGRRARQRARAAGIDIPEPANMPPKKPSTYFRDKRAYPDSTYDFNLKLRADRQTRILKSRRTEFRDLEWQLSGPDNIGGRITSLGISRQNPNLIYAGAADGGLLKSTDGGVSWQTLFDDQYTLSIGAVAVHPDNDQVVYVGTGEANMSSDSYHGDGVYLTTDGGQTWTNIGLPDSRRIGRIALVRSQPDTLYVAVVGNPYGTSTDRGLYRTYDGGQTWTRCLYINSNTGAVDVVLHPNDPQTVYVATYNRYNGSYNRVYRSNDGGDTWTMLTNGLPTASNVGRIGLALCQTQPAVLYAIYADNSPGYFLGLYKTQDGGSTWTQTNDTILDNMYSSYGWWFGNVRVAPDNPNRVYALGLELWYSNNGGDAWSVLSDNTVHVDQHDLLFDPFMSSRLILGNDGGVFVSGNNGANWTKSYNLPVTQFYDIEVDPNNPDVLYGGTQDNGSLKGPNGLVDNWFRILGGDGFYCLVAADNSNIVFAEYQFGNLFKSTNGGITMTWAMNGLDDSDRRNWNTPVVFDPQDSDVLYYGSYRVWKTTNQAADWLAVSGDLTNGGTVSTLDVSPLNGEVVYAGTSDGNVWVSLSGGASWQQINQALPNRYITRVSASLHMESQVFVCLSGYFQDDFTSHVYGSDDYGATWYALGSNLPGTPTNDILQDPLYPDILYLGADHGLFVSVDFGASWSLLGSGLPNSVVDDIDLHLPTRTLYAGTHGRSIWQVAASSLLPQLIGDLDENGLVNLVDLIRLVVIIMELGEPPSAYEFWASDLNTDGRLDLLDVLMLVDIIQAG